MIIVHRIGKSNEEIVINAELIETLEEKPDTIIKLTTGKKILVTESKEEIVDLVVKYKRSILL
ncbi:MAG: flagellar FlbD family protein [Fusobacteriota bacterium]